MYMYIYNSTIIDLSLFLKQKLEGNQMFKKICGQTSLQSLTAFDIVEPNAIPKLYEIFLIALLPDQKESLEYLKEETLRLWSNNINNNNDVNNNDVNSSNSNENNNNNKGDNDEDVKYPSVTIPCTKFGTCSIPLYITVSLLTSDIQQYFTHKY